MSELCKLHRDRIDGLRLGAGSSQMSQVQHSHKDRIETETSSHLLNFLFVRVS